jgi:hypothetical protein
MYLEQQEETVSEIPAYRFHYSLTCLILQELSFLTLDLIERRLDNLRPIGTVLVLMLLIDIDVRLQSKVLVLHLLLLQLDLILIVLLALVPVLRVLIGVVNAPLLAALLRDHVLPIRLADASTNVRQVLQEIVPP